MSNGCPCTVRSSKSAWINLHTTLNTYAYGRLGIKSDKRDLSNLKLDDVGDCGESKREREKAGGGWVWVKWSDCKFAAICHVS